MVVPINVQIHMVLSQQWAHHLLEPLFGRPRVPCRPGVHRAVARHNCPLRVGLSQRGLEPAQFLRPGATPSTSCMLSLPEELSSGPSLWTSNSLLAGRQAGGRQPLTSSPASTPDLRLSYKSSKRRMAPSATAASSGMLSVTTDVMWTRRCTG